MNKKIYIIDDSPSDLNSIKNALSENLECEIMTFLSGLEAVESIKDKPADIVIVDTLLQDTDGFEVCSAIRKLYGSDEVKIIMVTKYIDAVDAVTAKSAGADDYAPKTSDSQVIVEAVIRNIS